MNAPIKIGLAGIGGYGESYLEALLPRQEALGARLVGAVDPMPHRCHRLHDLQQAGIPVYSSLADLFNDSGIDLMLIVTPIHLHAEHCCFALNQGVNVLCEKPLAGALPDALHMLEVQKQSSAFAAIGFQWSFSQAVQALKRDVMEGVLGRPLRLKSLVLFPRPISYFCRNDWAGRKRMPDGHAVFDSPVNNATAHYLHNMLYLLGQTRETSAMPTTVQAELYRANDIENYDTAALRLRTGDGVEVLFYTSHAAHERRGPQSRYEFENAVVDFDTANGGEFVARFHDGRVKNYGHPNADRHEKIWDAIASARDGRPVACGISTAIPHAVCVAAAQDSAAQIVNFPLRARRLADCDGDPMIAIDQLGEQLTDCYRRDMLPGEHKDLAWARPSAAVEIGAQRETRQPAVAVTLHPETFRAPWQSVESR